MVVELGAADLLVGRLDAGEPLPELVSVPSVGRYGQLDMERLLSLQPDLLLLWPGSVGVARCAPLHIRIRSSVGRTAGVGEYALAGA